MKKTEKEFIIEKKRPQVLFLGNGICRAFGGMSWNGLLDELKEKNQYVYSPYDIPYTVSVNCPNDVTCTLDKTSSTVYQSSTNHSDTVTLSVNPSRNYTQGETLTIIITAQSTSPYIETISAIFQYSVGQQGVSYEIEDEANRVYAILKITNA